MKWQCHKFQGMIAASLYEELSAGEGAELESHLEHCAGCRQEATALGDFVARVPTETAAPGRDLLADVRVALEQKTMPVSWAPSWAAAAAVAIVLVTVSVSVLIMNGTPSPGPQLAVDPSQSSNLTSPLESYLAEADAHMARHDFSAAYSTLARGVARYSDDDRAGVAQAQLARIAFTELHWYPEAYEAYNKLRADYGEAFLSEPENQAIYSLEILDEARGADGQFSSLHALDAAENEGSFEKLESVIGDYPGGFVAVLASSSMARLSAEEEGLDVESTKPLLAMEAALVRCTNPVAVAQLKLEVGHLYRAGGTDLDKARMLYQEVATFSASTVLASLAQDALIEMDGNSDL